MQPVSLLNTLISLFALVIGGGVIFNAILLVQHDRKNRSLILLCVALLFWGVLYLIEVTAMLPTETTVLIRWQALATAFTLTVFAYALFIAQYMINVDRLARVLMFILPIFTLITLGAIWTGFVFNSAFELHPLGIVVLAGGLLYTLYALWIVLTSPQAVGLRISAFLMIVGVISQLFDVTRAYPIGLLCTALAILLIGWNVLRAQLTKPLNDLSEELRVANRDLRQVVTDLATERSRGAEVLKQLETAQSYGQYKNDFLNALGHRLRTPLNSIVGYSELLESGTYGDLTDKQQDRLNKIHRNGDTLLAVINDMIDLNRIDAGQLNLQLHNVSLRNVVARTVSAFDAERAAKNITFQVDIRDNASMVRADDERLEQALMPLLDHAVQAQTGSVIHLQSERITVKNGVSTGVALPLIGWLGDGDWIILQVRDQSEGIEPELQPQVFDEFYQPPDTDGQDLHGTGLGLTIAKKLIELHQGVLWLKSSVEQGTTFFVALRSVES